MNGEAEHRLGEFYFFIAYVKFNDLLWYLVSLFVAFGLWDKERKGESSLACLIVTCTITCLECESSESTELIASSCAVRCSLATNELLVICVHIATKNSCLIPIFSNSLGFYLKPDNELCVNVFFIFYINIYEDFYKLDF